MYINVVLKKFKSLKPINEFIFHFMDNKKVYCELRTNLVI